MPNRIVRADILTSERVARLSWPAEVFYRRLMSVVDDFGRYDGRNSVLRTALYPIQVDKVTERDVGKWKAETASADLVTCYAIDGKDYVQIERFGASRADKSKYPAPELRTDANSCEHLQTSARSGEQNLPYSYSYSGSYSNPLNPPEGVCIRKLSERETVGPAELDVWFLGQPEMPRCEDNRLKVHALWQLSRSKEKPLSWLKSALGRAMRGEWWKFSEADIDAAHHQIRSLQSGGGSGIAESLGNALGGEDTG